MLFVAPTGACIVSPGVETILDEGRAGHHLLVQLEAAEPGKPVQFGHPLTGEEHELSAELDALLAELAYGRPKGKRLYPLLELDDRQRLATALARGLLDAGPRERVRFWLSIEDGELTPWLTPTARQTRGVAFVDLEGRFHLAFDLLDDRVDPNASDNFDPTERAQTRARLVSETGEELGRAADGGRRLGVTWALVDSPSAPAPATDELSNTNAAKLELLDELLQDEIIDREEYERRRAKIGQPDAQRTP